MGRRNDVELTDQEVSSDKNKYRKSKRSSRPTKGREAPSGSRIPAGFGIMEPKFLKSSNSDEDAFQPLGFSFGKFLPLGDSASNTYSDIGYQYARTVLIKLKMLGYENSYTDAQVIAYINAASLLHQLYHVVMHIRTLARHTDVHTAVPIKELIDSAITGKLIARHRQLGKTLSVLPYPQVFADCLNYGLSASTLSDNPNSPIRIFAPKAVQPANGTSMDAGDLISEIESANASFFGVPANVELAAILQKVFGNGVTYPEYLDTHYKFNGNVINNLLNVGMWYGQGPTYAPFYAANEVVPLFYRRNLDWYGMLTFSPDDDVITPPEAGTVWQVTDSVLDTTDQNMIVSNTGILLDINQDEGRFQSFGTIWEASATLNISAGIHVSTTRVYTNLNAVAIGMADKLLTI
jgi:hypothetical protein